MSDWLPEDSLGPSFMAEEQAMFDEAERAREDRLLDECKSDWKPAKRVKRSDTNAAGNVALRWKLAVLDRDQGCVVHDDPALCQAPFESHHVLYAQHIRKDPRITRYLYDPRIGCGVCSLAHRQHHNGSRRIRLAEIPLEVVAFIEALGYSEYLHRRYETLERAA